MQIKATSILLLALFELGASVGSSQAQMFRFKKREAGRVSHTRLNAPTCTAAQQKAMADQLANANPNSDCTLIVPRNPLTVEGLATPYRLTATDPSQGSCRQANPNQGAYVEATIFDPKSNTLSVYHPLVIDDFTAPLARPTRPNLPPGAIVGLWIGSNATFARLSPSPGDTLDASHCVTGLGADAFGQVSACNASAFFQAVYSAVEAHKLSPPTLGYTRTDGKACPTTRDFMIVDQDQSDNVITSYLADSCGNTAQYTPANATAFGSASVITNGSDNRLLGRVLTAIGCRDWEVTDMTDATGATRSSSQALHEVRANTYQGPPVALMPLGDPMALLGGEPNNQNGKPSVAKMNLLRAQVGQPPNVKSDNARYCAGLLIAGAGRLADPANAVALSAAASPSPDVGSNLYTFLGARFAATFGPPADGAGLGPVGCTDLIDQPNPAQLTINSNGVATAVKFIRPQRLPSPVQ